MIVDISQRPEYLGFVSKHTGTRDFGPCKTIAFYGDGLEAVIVYNAKDESNIGMSIASTTPKWCKKSVLKIAFGFPFMQLGLNRVTGIQNEFNHKARSLVERLGFELEGEMKQYYQNGESAMIYGMTKDNCRWLK